jgi:hypothetical protein
VCSWELVMRYKYIAPLCLMIILCFFFCSNRIIEHAASEYFLWEEGNWWRYASDSETAFVEVEAPDTLLGVEFFRISFSGYLKYLAKEPEAVEEYIKIVYNFSGSDYTILENYMVRIQLPLVNSNSWQDSLIDSLNVSDQWVKAMYYTDGRIADITFEKDFAGDVYKIVLTTIKSLISPDTAVVDTHYVEEYYAPNIGLVRFTDGDKEYTLVEYNIQ